MMKLTLILIGFLFSYLAFALDGDAEREQVKAAITVHSSEIRKCYKDNQKTLKKAEGKIFVEFEVNDQGTLIKSEVNAKKSTLKNEGLIKCMQEKFQAWIFPLAPKGQTITVIYPFAFKQPKE